MKIFENYGRLLKLFKDIFKDKWLLIKDYRNKVGQK